MKLVARILLPEGLLPDELLYSGLARSQDMSAFPTRRAMLAQAFGAVTGIAIIDLPGRLEVVASRLGYLEGSKDPAGLLIRQHSLFPYYAPFVPEERAARCEALMRSGPAGPIHGLLGIRASRVPLPSRMQYCRSCFEQDRDRYGAAYWHRCHQLSGVFVCPVHAEPLLGTRLLRSSSRDRLAFVSLEQAASISDLPPVSSALLSGLAEGAALALAGRSAALLEQGLEPRSFGPNVTGQEGWRNWAISSLRSAGYGRGPTGVAVARFRHDLSVFYGSDILALLGCELVETGEDWIARLLHVRKLSSHPLHFLLVRVFLEAVIGPQRDVEGGGVPSAAPVGAADGTRCPERICAGLLEGREAPESSRGTSTCPDCGCCFTIGSGGPRLVAHGPKWDALLEQLLRKPEVSLRQVSRILQVDPLTVKRHGLRLGLWRPQWSGYSRAAPATGRVKKCRAARAGARRKWRRTVARYPRASRKELRALQPAAFAILYRHDREWLDAHSPPRRRAGSTKATVDWNDRDREMADRLERMSPCDDERTSLRVATVARSIDRLGLIQQQAHKLPRTMAVLGRFTETRDEFSMRRIAGAIRRHRGAGSAPAISTLARDAGLNSERTRLFEPMLAAAVAELARAAQL
ncbi:MAG: TnsD family Tn7-like transposition protein [Allosphingosinicella sp.]